MTEFKKGDRVKVEFEGVVKDIGSKLLVLEVNGVYRSARQSDATLLELPVEPLAPGSVVRGATDGDVWVVQSKGRVHYISQSGAQFASAHDATSLAKALRDHSDTHILIHDGSKK